jgi:methylated-DNA-[protein]-cysteine S-methyltransferase
MSIQQVFLHEAHTRYGPVFLAASDRGLCRVTVPGETVDELLSWIERKRGRVEIVPGHSAIADAADALSAFLETGDPLPPLPIDLIGTPFQRAVWEAVLRIPYGQTRSYADIAVEIGYPRASRAVGSANAVNPLPFVVPCHRVIGADGTIKGFPGGVVTRAMLLQLEAQAAPR